MHLNSILHLVITTLIANDNYYSFTQSYICWNIRKLGMCVLLLCTTCNAQHAMHLQRKSPSEACSFFSHLQQTYNKHWCYTEVDLGLSSQIRPPTLDCSNTTTTEAHPQVINSQGSSFKFLQVPIQCTSNFSAQATLTFDPSVLGISAHGYYNY